jgi:hypothetical protein
MSMRNVNIVAQLMNRMACMLCYGPSPGTLQHTTVLRILSAGSL